MSKVLNAVQKASFVALAALVIVVAALPILSLGVGIVA